MTPAKYGRHLATQEPPLTDDEIETIARTLTVVLAESQAAAA